MGVIDLAHDDDVVALEPERVSLVARAQSLVIKTADMYEEAAGWLRSVKTALKRIEDARNRVKQPILEAGRAIDAQAKEAAAPWLEAEAKIKTQMLGFQREQDRIRQEEQRRLNEAAEKERRRLQAIADEAARKAREEAEAKRRAAEEAAAAGRAEEAARLAAQAAKVEEKAAAKAEAFQDRAAAVVAPIAQAAAPKMAGISMREVWRFEIVDPARVNAAFMIPDEAKIRKTVQALKGDAGAVVGPGVRIYAEKQLAAGAT